MHKTGSPTINNKIILSLKMAIQIEKKNNILSYDGMGKFI